MSGCLLTAGLFVVAAVTVPTIFISRWLAEGERQLEADRVDGGGEKSEEMPDVVLEIRLD